MESQEIILGKDFDVVLTRAVSALEKQDFINRLWQRDTSLWPADYTGKKIISNSLGWLDSIEPMQQQVEALSSFRDELLNDGFTHAVCIGMGGSGMAPLVMQQCLKPVMEGLDLTIIDTTDPQTVIDLRQKLPLAATLFIVASKSGTTAEPLSLMEYFYQAAGQALGAKAGQNFVAITDPGSKLSEQAVDRGFRRVFLGIPDIGGRYSALSPFGMVPAAVAGLNIGGVLERASQMADACRSQAQDSPGSVLGAVIGELAKAGRDKLTLIASNTIASFGLWLEQLIAESTGKDGKGILPVAGEPLGSSELFDKDRIFVQVSLDGESQPKTEAALETLRQAGHPVVRITMRDALDIGAEFMRWEVATATAGAVLKINPFDQPNVQESKDVTNGMLAQLQETGSLPQEETSAAEGPLKIYGSVGEKAAGFSQAMASFFFNVERGDYISLMAFITETPENGKLLENIRVMLRDKLTIATTSGYGPRFLHSTGQYHKGGKNNGVFIQLTTDDASDAPVPGSAFTFGQFKRAQALGDFETLRRHGRRAIRVHLGPDVTAGLRYLQNVISRTLA